MRLLTALLLVALPGLSLVLWAAAAVVAPDPGLMIVCLLITILCAWYADRHVHRGGRR
jgi:hypothetical protein